MDLGRWVLVVAVVAVVGVGAWRAVTDGRFRSRRTGGQDALSVASVLDGTSYDARRGERATLLQFSSAFCAPCRATRGVLASVADVVPGVAHVEVDAERELELVRRLGVLRTPTTLVLDSHGREVTRAGGAPRREQVLSALEATL